MKIHPVTVYNGDSLSLVKAALNNKVDLKVIKKPSVDQLISRFGYAREKAEKLLGL
jgi:hypothetical protein